MITWRRASVAALLLANAYPLIGLLYLDWKPGDVLIAYWLENVAVGIWTVLKIATATGANSAATAGNGLKFVLVPFFCVHYGIFTIGHGVFALIIANDIGFSSASAKWSSAFLVLFVSHGMSFLGNWVLGGERSRTSPSAAMAHPYGRIVVLHVAVLGGFFLITRYGGDPRNPALLLIGLKTLLDLGLFAASHRPLERTGGGG